MWAWLDLIGINRDHIRVREHATEELSHYSERTVDFEYLFPNPMGWKELYGLANRTDFDLRQHQEHSGEDLTYFDQPTGTRFLPHVIEPTFGVERTFLMILLDAYDEEQTRRQWQAGHPGRAATPSARGAVQGGNPAACEEAGIDRSRVANLRPDRGRNAVSGRL
ncbi:MAG: hypothetical protein R2843_05155 [Thermomicrobiales bacterium]